MTDSANAGALTVTTSSPGEQRQGTKNKTLSHTYILQFMYPSLNKLKLTVGNRCPEVLDLEDAGTGFRFSAQVKNNTDKINNKYTIFGLYRRYNVCIIAAKTVILHNFPSYLFECQNETCKTFLNVTLASYFG